MITLYAVQQICFALGHSGCINLCFTMSKQGAKFDTDAKIYLQQLGNELAREIVERTY